MTTSMSSTSDGINEGSPPSGNRLSSPRSRYTPLSSHRSSFLYGSAGESTQQSQDQAASHSNEFESFDRAPADRRVSRSKGFLLDSSTRKHGQETVRDGYGTSERSSQAITPTKGKSRANRRSLLGTDVMRVGDGQADNRSATSSGEPSSATESKTKHASQTNTDHAQIVNLALTLSESRRRHFSSNRISSMADANMHLPPGNTASPLLATPNSANSQSRRIYTPSARSSADIFPSTPNSRSSPIANLSPGRLNFDSDSPSRVFGPASLVTEEFSPSEATILRVQRAKESLELTYEYRRLLQYLPKLPARSGTRTYSGHKALVSAPDGTSLGRDYNPLQYIRNRKIRRREDKHLNAAGHGWKNVSAVRQWIDDVSDEREKRVSSANDRFPLPTFPLTTDSTQPAMQILDSALSSPGTANAVSKEARPYVDWIIEPWNLLADAYWIEQGNNKHLIEDAGSQRLYPPTLSAPIDLRKEAIRASTRRSLSIPRSVRNSNSIASLDPGKLDGTTIERGRQSHSRHRSIDSGRGYSGSRDRKGKWRRFIGSQSPSSTEESISGTQQTRPYKASRLSTKEKQELLIPERQITELMAKQSQKEKYSQDDNTRMSIDDQVFNGMSSRPSSPEEASLGTLEKDLSTHLGLVDRTREMQPRRFSTNLSSELKQPPKRPSIAINISPPRSQSRDTRRLDNMSTGSAIVSLPNSDDEAKLSPKAAHRYRRSSDTGVEWKSRDSKDFESRLRGLLKGTKIMDMVSQPVVKVGDLIWKRDDQSQDPLYSSTPSIYNDSDAEDLAMTGTFEHENGPEQATGRYRANKLPNFSSAPRGRRQDQSSETAISDLTTENGISSPPKENGQTAPQNLKIETSPSSRNLQSLQSPEQSRLLPIFNVDRSMNRARSTQRRHAITKIGGSMTPTKSTILPKQASWPDKDSLRWINVTQRLLSSLHRPIRPKDIAALQVLTQCTLQTTNNILYQINHPVYSSKPSNTRSIHASTRYQVQSSQSLLLSISQQNTSIKANLSTNSQTTIPEIHNSLTQIETHIIDELTPIVRMAGENADKLSAELATTRTLEVKKLNDELDFISRRRRRKFRWLRRGLYWSLEWTLLGLMWWAWLIVVCLRLIRGTFRVTRAVGAWLFWL